MLKKVLSICTLCLSLALVGCSSGGEDNKEENNNITVNSITYDGTTLKWSSPSNKVIGYDITINGKKFEVNETQYQLESNQDLDITLTSKTKTEEKSSTFKFEYGGTFEQPIYSTGTLSWGKCNNAISYVLDVNNNIINVNEEKYESLKTGENVIKVRPVVKNESSAKYYINSTALSLNILEKPVISFDKVTNTISWSQVPNAKGYSILIRKDGNKVIDVPQLGADANNYTAFTFDEAGSYSIEVCSRGDASKGNNDSGYAKETVKRLEMPKNIKTQEKEGNILITWDKVVGADSYLVKLPNGSESVVKEEVYTLPLSENVQQQKYKISILSQANDDLVLNSKESAKVELTRLEKVTNVRMQDGFIVWDEVPMAQEYIINIDGRDFVSKTNRYEVIVAEGSHKVRIKACGDYNYVLSSPFSNTEDFYKLAAPKNVRFENGNLVWDAVTNASNYNVISENGNINKNVNSTTLLINSSEITESTTIHVIARGNGNMYLDSDSSKSKSVYKLECPQLKLNKNGIEWNSVVGAVEYELKIGDYVRNVNGTSFNLSEFEPKSYVCSVRAIGDRNTYFDSRLSESISANVLNKPTITVEDGVLSWNSVLLSNGYEVFVDGKDTITLPFNERTYKPNFKTAGLHTISVRTLGDGSKTCNSNWSEVTINSQLLIAPVKVNIEQIEENKFKFYCDPIENAKSYVFVINGVEVSSDVNEYIYETTTPGDYKISVKGLGNGYDYVDSNNSKESSLIILNPVIDINMSLQDIDQYALTWKPTSHAYGYNVKVTKTMKDGTEQVSNKVVTGTTLSVDTLNVAKVTVEITSLGSGNVYNSKISSFEKVFN